MTFIQYRCIFWAGEVDLYKKRCLHEVAHHMDDIRQQHLFMLYLSRTVFHKTFTAYLSFHSLYEYIVFPSTVWSLDSQKIKQFKNLYYLLTSDF